MLIRPTHSDELTAAVMPRSRRASASGAALLEVVVSLGLLVFAMAMVGMQIHSGIDAARASDIGTRAVMLVDTKLAELYAGVLLAEETEDQEMRFDQQEKKGDFGILYPGFTWMIEFEPVDENEKLIMVTIKIGYNESMIQHQIDNPDYELDIEDDEGTRIVRTAYLLWPVSAKISLVRDYGISQDDLDAAMASLGDAVSGAAGGGGEGGAEGGDGGEANDLLADALSQYGDVLADLISDPEGFDPRMLVELAGDDFMELAGFVNSLITGEVNANSIADLLRNQSVQNMMQKVDDKKDG
ncbi:MAG: hypothetical protein ACYTF1_20820 [Planctomycetota bacterium]|jgi:hypothetical protein